MFFFQAKTPPRYPPSNPRYQPTLSTFSPRHQDQNSSTSSKMSNKSSSGGREGSNGSGPPTRSRDHLRIEQDGHLAIKGEAPEPPSRPQNGVGSADFSHSLTNGENGSHSGTVTPSKEQYERIVKYQAEIKAHRQDKETRLREDEFLRNSMRQSDRLRALEASARSSRGAGVRGVSNAGYSTVGEEPRQLSVSEIQEALARLKVNLPESCLSALQSTEAIVAQPDFAVGLDVCQKLQAAWCYSAPPAAVCCDAQELAEDCLSLSDGTSSTGLEQEPAASELASILRKESLEGLLYVHDKLAERYSLLNSLGEDDVILDRVSHYAEPNIKVS